MILSLLNYGDMGKCPHKSPSPCNTCHTHVIIQICVLICHKKCAHMHTHTHTHTHTRTYTHTHTHSLSLSLSEVWGVTDRQLSGNWSVPVRWRVLFIRAVGNTLPLQCNPSSPCSPNAAVCNSLTCHKPWAQRLSVCVCVCVRACVRACVCVCVRETNSDHVISAWRIVLQRIVYVYM